MSDIAIRVENLSKLYRLGQKEDRPDTLAGALVSTLKAPFQNFRRLRGLTRFGANDSSDDVLWALRDVSFEVARGEVVGIIGSNGAGKSTLLKILSRITEPTRGRATVRGRVGSLLEVGTGFHPELTGRENIYMNGTILGMTKREIDRKFDEIVEFSGIEKFLDTPVKRYSSGMAVRLAFAVAAHLEPDTVIVDEVLAVGDFEFQNKCIGKMQSISESEGRTVLFVSHNMGAIRNLCGRVLVLRRGEIVCDDSPEKAIDFFLGSMMSKIGSNTVGDNPNRSGDGRVRIVAARVLNERGLETYDLIAGERATFEFEYVNPGRIESADAFMTIFNQFGVPVTHVNTELLKWRFDIKSNGVLRCTIPSLPLPLGKYSVGVLVRDKSNVCDHIPDVLGFNVVSSVFFADGQIPSMRASAALVVHSWSAQ